MSTTAAKATISDDSLVNIGRSIDRLLTVEMRRSSYSRGVIANLFDAASEKQGGGPLSMMAARALAERVRPRDVVLIATGAGDPEYLPVGETDGPPGAAALAAALSIALDAVPILLTEGPFVENLRHTALAAGLGPRTPDVARRVAGTTTVLPIADDESALQQAQAYLEEFDPKAVIAIEKLGPNSKGVAHSASGRRTGAGRGRAETLFELARQRGVLTIGIGDNGNEIGFGLIEAAVRAFKPFGMKCQCPCGAGIATTVSTDILIPANTSNWGAYGVAAALAAITGNPDAMHDAEMERRVVETCVEFGAADGSSGRHITYVDGTPLEAQASIVILLRTIVINGLATPPPRQF